MEKGVFGVICGLIGAAIGSVSTYFLTKNRIENSVREECEGRFRKAQNDLNEYYKTNFEPKKEPVKDSILMQAAYKKRNEKASDELGSVTKMGLEEKETEDKLREKFDINPIDYDQFYTEKDLDEADNYYLEYGNYDPKYPHIITHKQFLEDNGNVKLKLTYYEESGVFAHTGNLTDSGFTIDYFGSQNLSEFGNYKYDDGEMDPYMLWFRSENDGTDFQIYYEPYATYEEDLAKEGNIIDE